jgi:hypothetical protein
MDIPMIPRCLQRGSLFVMLRGNLLLTNIGLCYYTYIFLPESCMKFHVGIERNSRVSQLQIFVIRAVVGLAFAMFATKVFYGNINPYYVVGLAVILVGLAYFAEFLRNRKSR